MNTLNINQTAHQLNHHRINTIPTRDDTSKRPVIAWKQWATDPVPATNIDTWFPQGTNHGIGITTGQGSGQLEMTEIEGRAAHHIPTLIQRAKEAGHSELVNRIMAGWTEQSPSGGYHWIYRLEGMDVPGNTVLAQKPNTDPDTTKKVDVLIETRGQGGYFIAAPTPGTHHETGKPWVRLTGGPETIATLTPEERAAFHTLLTTFDETPPAPARAYNEGGDWTEGKRPGEHFELETSWDEILTPHGWTYHHQGADGTHYWTRPDKDTRNGWSASTGRADDRDRLWSYSTSTEFEQEIPYTKFGAWALLNHGGDHAAAAQALAHDGWGKERTIDINIADLMPATRKDPSWNSSTTSSSTTPQTTTESSPHTPSKRETTTPPYEATNTTEPANTSATSSSTTTSSTPANDSKPSTGTTSNSATDNAASTSTTGSESSTSSTPTAPSTNQPATTLAETDDGNAHRLIHHHGQELRYCAERGQWLHWDNTRWAFQGPSDIAARELAKHVARQLPESDTSEKNWKKRSLSAAGVTNTLKQAETHYTIAINFDDLDNQPWELNTPDGIINLKTGELTPSDPEKLHTKTTTTSPDPTADRTLWDQFLTDTFPDRTIRDYMQRLIGYAAIGEVQENVLPFAYGPGGNGKSVFFETIAGVLGDYATAAPAGFLMEQRFPQHPTEMARLVGQRLVISQEFNERDRFDEAKVKSLTGGDSITARFTHKDDFTFTPSHTLFIAGNHEPTVESGGDGFWRRLRKIPFLHKVPDHKKVGNLQQVLLSEHAPAILAWIVEGAAWYSKDGLMEPESVRTATEDYREAQDTVARFLEERCILYPGNENYTCSVKRFRAEYEAWCFEEGESPVKGRGLAAQLKNQGVLVGRDAPAQASGRGRVYGGLRLASDEEAIEAEHHRQDLF